MALGGEGLDEIARISALDGARCRQHGNQARTGALRRRFDGGHGADKSHLRKAGAKIGTREREGRVAGDDADFRAIILQQRFEERENARLQRLLLPAAIGKTRIVGHIDETALRHQHARLAQNRQPANAGIEHQHRFQYIGGRLTRLQHAPRFPSPIFPLPFPPGLPAWAIAGENGRAN
ncbi:hypothetical protein D3C78_1357310 [compost metagenome]